MEERNVERNVKAIKERSAEEKQGKMETNKEERS
jgi:hypothetical protein